MSELHPVEAAWRQFRNIRGVPDVLQGAFQTRDLTFPPALSLLPDRVVLPSSIAENELRRRGETKKGVRDFTVLFMTVHVWAAYRESKTIYEVEPQLAECLARTSWPTDTPTAALALKSFCPIVALPGDRATRYVAITYDYGSLEPAAPGLLMLNLSWLTECLWTPCGRLILTGDDLGACLRAARASILLGEDLQPLVEEPEWAYQLTGRALAVLLYLAGEPDIVRMIHPGEKRRVKPSMERREPERFKDLREPTVYAVGKSFTRAIERWEIEHASERGEPTGRTVRPHMRRAHAHLYWTGEGRTLPRVRFLLPVSVKGEKLVEEPETPRITPVR